MDLYQTSKTRDALEILWSSLATIITCTYTILHLNVPEQRQGRDPGWKGDIKWCTFWNNLKWSIITIVFPEFILAKSISDWTTARAELKALRARKPETKATWHLTHMLFAEMGGFVVEYHENDRPEDNLDDAGSATHTIKMMPMASSTASSSQLILAHDAATAISPPAQAIVQHIQSHHASVNSAVSSTLVPCVVEAGAHTETPRHDVPKLFHLTAKSIRRAVVEGLLPSTIVPADEILDRSKSSSFTKVLTVGQALWFLVEFFVRRGRGLPTIPLEIGVLAFVVFASCTYLFVLSKPKDVATVIPLRSYAHFLPTAVKELAHSARVEYRTWDDNYKDGAPLPNDNGLAEAHAWYALGAGVVLGVLHLCGWNMVFPTTVDAWLWRSAALTVSCDPILLVLTSSALSLLDGFVNVLSKLSGRFLDFVITSGLYFIGISYVGARVIIFVEMFRCLFYLPPGALISTWATNVPHIG